MSTTPRDPARLARRFGPAELFGQAVSCLDPAELRSLASTPNSQVVCPFKPDHRTCHKRSGVCSIALFQRDDVRGATVTGPPVSLCPSRFLQNRAVFAWVGEQLLGTTEPQIVPEVPFLRREMSAGARRKEAGRIDHVLVRSEADRFRWCALEMQAVYFSGEDMEHDLGILRTWEGPGLPFPRKLRRPDYRSSGQKRLMPQLQTKVPTLRRWGKKTAVVVDAPFWEALGEMRVVEDLSSADIAWFVLGYDGPTDKAYRLTLRQVMYTTLEDAVSGLTGGTPVSLEQFEEGIRLKLGRLGAS